MGLRRATTIFMAAWLGAASGALAHPHVFVDVELGLDVGDDGALRAVRHDWTFDDMYSAFAVQGLPRANGAPTSEALAKLAADLVEKLEDSDFFTKVAAEDQELQPTGVSGARAEMIDGRLRLSFAIGVRAIIGAPAQVSVRVFDPQYIVAMTVRETVRIAGPDRCRHRLIPPGVLDAADARQLDDSLRTNQLAPGFGAKLATAVALDCRRTP